MSGNELMLHVREWREMATVFACGNAVVSELAQPFRISVATGRLSLCLPKRIVKTSLTAQLNNLQVGLRHEFVETREFENPLYVANQADRCYHCKDEPCGKTA